MSLAPVNHASILRANAHAVPIADGTVSLIVSSPPYWALRVYEDDGEVYDGQIGSEPNPGEFLVNLWRSMDEAWRCLRDDGVGWINLGDKYAGSGGHNNSGVAATKGRSSGLEGGGQFSHQPVARTQASGLNGNRPAKPPAARAARTPMVSRKQAEARDEVRGQGQPGPAARASRAKVTGTRRQAPDRYEQGTEWARAKSLMGLPWAFVLGLIQPDLYRNHLDPPPLERCPAGCEAGMLDRAATPEEVDDGCELGVFFYPCPTCEGTGTVAGQHPQWVWRGEQVWDKPNGLPESVTDRPRRSHEVWLMVTKNGKYFGTVDELREPYLYPANGAMFGGAKNGAALLEQGRTTMGGNTYDADSLHPLGKVPGSVWRIASEPFADELFHLDDQGARVVDAAELAELNRWRAHHGEPLYTVPHEYEERGRLAALRRVAVAEGETPTAREAEHFAPFPSEWPRRLILGWSPSGICTVCDTGRFPVVAKRLHPLRDAYDAQRPGRHDATDDGMRDNGYTGNGKVVAEEEATILGYACACTPMTDHGPAGSSWNDADAVPREGKRAKPDGAQNLHKARRPRKEFHLDGWDAPPTRPAVVLDCFGGTGTTALVASVHGRVGISADLSWDYSRLAQWRTRNQRHRDKVRRRTANALQDSLDLNAALFPEPEATAMLARDVAHAVPVHARADDPTTSRKAAVNVMPRAGTQKVKVLAHLATHPTGMTGDDLCAILGDKNGSSWRSRLASLREDYDPPLVVRTTTERTTRSGEVAYVHHITDAGRKVLADLNGGEA